MIESAVSNDDSDGDENVMRIWSNPLRQAVLKNKTKFDLGKIKRNSGPHRLWMEYSDYTSSSLRGNV